MPIFDGLDRLISETSPQGNITYQYDPAGRTTTMAVAGQPLVNYGYDNGDRLLSITQGNSTVGFQYDAANRRQSLTLANGIVATYTYDAASRPTGVSYQGSGNLIGNLSYAYDALSRVQQMSGSLAHTILPSALASATYDSANRLSTWNGQTFSYDNNGNLVGDGINTYSWDARNQLASITGSANASFIYDPLGRRVSKTIGGIATGYLYDGANIVQELSGASPVANSLTGGIDEVFARTDSASYSFLTDLLGSTLALTDASGSLTTQYSYGPFGQTASTGAASTNPFQYTSRENDSTGLQYNRSRYYHPGLQRFISQDPIGFGGGDTNLYAYTGNNPVNFTDPTGNVFGIDDVFEGVGVCLATPACATLLTGTAAYLYLLATRGSAPPLSLPTSTPADPNGRNSHPDPKKDPCEWPDNPEDMDDLLNQEGQRIPDRPGLPGPPDMGTPGRGKVEWDLGMSKIIFEGHPYHPGSPDWHRLPHWHLDTPGKPHQRFRPGDKIPNCKE